MRTNTIPASPSTHEGAPAVRINPLSQLRRSVLACLLWEDSFYESGVEIAKRIHDFALQVKVEELAALAIEARHVQHLRHAPLWLLCALIERGRGQSIVADTIAQVVSRADEPGELIAMYWKDGKKPLAAQLKKGLAKAICKFDRYQLSKYKSDKDAVRLRDALFLSHAKPKDEAQAASFKALADQTLEAADTWEVALSAGKDKKESFERLLREKKLGYLALLRNLRNMITADVDETLIREAIAARKGADRVLPFRYVAAARAAPRLEPYIDAALCESIESLPALPGKTIVLVDVSGSMDSPLSAKSDLKRTDAAAALASVMPGQIMVFTFSDRLVEVPPRRGMAGIDAILKSQPRGGTQMGAAVAALINVKAERLIVITDEQSHDSVPRPGQQKGYIINVAAFKNGVGYGERWTHLDGFSENVLRWIVEYEQGAAR